MRDVRPVVAQLAALGRLPPEDSPVDWDDIDHRKSLLHALADEAPSIRDEVRELVGLFPPDDSECFELAWTLLHIIERSPSWPDWEALRTDRGWWGNYLAYRLQNAGASVPADLVPRDTAER